MSVRSWNEPTNRIDHQHRTRLIESRRRNHGPSSDLGLAVTGNAPEPVTRTHKKSPCLRETRGFSWSCWCPGAESNHRHEDFQLSCRAHFARQKTGRYRSLPVSQIPRRSAFARRCATKKRRSWHSIGFTVACPASTSARLRLLPAVPSSSASRRPLRS